MGTLDTATQTIPIPDTEKALTGPVEGMQGMQPNVVAEIVQQAGPEAARKGGEKKADFAVNEDTVTNTEVRYVIEHFPASLRYMLADADEDAIGKLIAPIKRHMAEGKDLRTFRDNDPKFVKAVADLLTHHKVGAPEVGGDNREEREEVAGRLEFNDQTVEQIQRYLEANGQGAGVAGAELGVLRQAFEEAYRYWRQGPDAYARYVAGGQDKAFCGALADIFQRLTQGQELEAPVQQIQETEVEAKTAEIGDQIKFDGQTVIQIQRYLEASGQAAGVAGADVGVLRQAFEEAYRYWMQGPDAYAQYIAGGQDKAFCDVLAQVFERLTRGEALEIPIEQERQASASQEFLETGNIYADIQSALAEGTIFGILLAKDIYHRGLTGSIKFAQDGEARNKLWNMIAEAEARYVGQLIDNCVLKGQIDVAFAMVQYYFNLYRQNPGALKIIQAKIGSFNSMDPVQSYNAKKVEELLQAGQVLEADAYLSYISDKTVQAGSQAIVSEATFSELAQAKDNYFLGAAERLLEEGRKNEARAILRSEYFNASNSDKVYALRRRQEIS